MLAACDLQLRTGQRISLTLERGSITCISGASGVGKTLLLRALADLDDAPGRVSLNDTPRESLAPAQWRRQVMLVPATPRWWQATPAEHMAAPVDDWLAALHLQPAILRAPCKRLSTGESLRLALLRALSLQPQVLLLDEPTAALDADTTAAVEALVQDYAREHAVLWVSHDAAQARRVAERRWQLDADALREVT